MSDAAVSRLLLFRVGTLVCAADLGVVREILPRLETTRIPGAMPFVAGLVNVRGQLVTVVEGWRALGQDAPVDAVPDEGQAGAGAGGGGHATGTTILIEVVGARGARRVVGLAVDDVVDLLTLEATALEPRAALAGVDPTLVRAVGRREDRAFVVLDTDALLAPVLTS
jgi:purine-binding chemotaxis protein CheW